MLLLMKKKIFFHGTTLLRPETLLKETPTQGHFCKYCEIFKNTSFHRTPSGDCFWILESVFFDSECWKYLSENNSHPKVRKSECQHITCPTCPTLLN